KGSLRGFDLVPDFVVLGAARNILPEVDMQHVGVGIVQMQGLFFGEREIFGGAGVCGSVVGDVADQFLCFGFDHIGEKFGGQVFVPAGGGDHQVIDPAGGVFFWNDFADGKIQFAKLYGVEWPAHGQNDFVVLKEVGEFSAGGPVFADIGLELE